MDKRIEECPDLDKCEQKVDEVTFENICQGAWQYCEYLSDEARRIAESSWKKPREWKEVKKNG